MNLQASSRSLFQALSLCVLMAMSAVSFATTAVYKITIQNDWTADNYPADYPLADGHFSWLGGGSHSPNDSFWSLGSLATPGLTMMAEYGNTTMFADEIAAAGGDRLEWKHWFCPPTTLANPDFASSCGPLSVELTLSEEKSAITLTTMLGPSPDWFVGVSGLDLRESGEWVDSKSIKLAIYDGGSEEGDIPIIDNAATNPLDVVHYVRYDAATGKYIESTSPFYVGVMHIERVSLDSKYATVVPETEQPEAEPQTNVPETKGDDTKAKTSNDKKTMDDGTSVAGSAENKAATAPKSFAAVAKLVRDLDKSNFTNKASRKKLLKRIRKLDRINRDRSRFGHKYDKVLRKTNGCGSSADDNDWVTDCATQAEIRRLLDSVRNASQ